MSPQSNGLTPRFFKWHFHIPAHFLYQIIDFKGTMIKLLSLIWISEFPSSRRSRELRVKVHFFSCKVQWWKRSGNEQARALFAKPIWKFVEALTPSSSSTGVISLGAFGLRKKMQPMRERVEILVPGTRGFDWLVASRTWELTAWPIRVKIKTETNLTRSDEFASYPLSLRRPEKNTRLCCLGRYQSKVYQWHNT